MKEHPSSEKTKSASSSSNDKNAKESKPEVKASPPPPLASVPEAKTKEEVLPFKLNERAELATETPSASGMLLRTFGALLLIIGFIAAAGWGLRYFGLINFGKQQGEAAGLKVMDTVQLGDRRTLTIVRFGERTLLIGSTPQGLTLLAEQADEVEVPNNFMPPVRTVTDLLDVNGQPQFEQELARASLINTPWSDGRVQ
ncbi:MAG: flagellar biosynthetic protein FliO [Blastocatellia bacterium]|nr:flagellar biosynthetic protein FliO [Blastocatellia bacterium]